MTEEVITFLPRTRGGRDGRVLRFGGYRPAAGRIVASHRQAYATTTIADPVANDIATGAIARTAVIASPAAMRERVSRERL